MYYKNNTTESRVRGNVPTIIMSKTNVAEMHINKCKQILEK